MQKVILYPHGGSGNHGCEALVRSTIKLIYPCKTILASRRVKEDEFYGVSEICDIVNEQKEINRWSFRYLLALIKFYFFGCKDAFETITYQEILASSKKSDVALSIGGDNYCYGVPTYIYIINRLLRRKGVPTVLWGCSIEPDSIDADMIDDLRQYNLIIARETITYNALVSSSLKNVELLPDPAFQLDRVELPLPHGFVEGNTVGINVSPMIMSNEQKNGITYNAYERLIEYIIDQTDMQIALIPHVVWVDNDDRIPLTQLYNKYISTGRVVILDDYNCMEIKGFISRCRFFIGARTHSTIAAYSTCVPTLVIGYSVKAKGIAKDIFGNWENYVLPVQGIGNENEIVEAFEWIMKNEDSIRKHLHCFIPEYCSKVLSIREKLLNLKK